MDWGSLSYGGFSPSPNEDEDDNSSSSSRIDPELEIALYSQIHFEQNPDAAPTDDQENQYVVEEEVPESPDEKELNWRERILENNIINIGAKFESNTSDVNATKSSAAIQNKKGDSLNKKLDNIILDVKYSDPKKSTKNETSAPPKKVEKKDQKKTRRDEHPAISSFLVRDAEPQSKVEALKSKYSSKKTSTPKPRQVVITEDSSSSSDSDVKELSMSDMIVIDSISDTDGGEKSGGSEKQVIEISDSDDENMFTVKKITYSSDDSSEDSICELNVTTDIKMNTTGLRKIEARPQKKEDRPLTNVSLENLALEDYVRLDVEDIHNSLAECDWSLSVEDKFKTSSLNTSRYFRKLDVKCHNCNERGHLSKICPQPKKQPVCILCGLEGHMSRSCPFKVCYNCFRVGHSRDSCAKPRRQAFAHCLRCDMVGHSEKDCTDLWRQYHITTKPGDLKKCPTKENKRKFCYNCARQGHFGYECREETMDYYRPAQYTQIARYSSVPHNTEYREESFNEDYPLLKSHVSNKERKRRKYAELQEQRRHKMSNKKVKNSAFVQCAQGSIGAKKNSKRKQKKKKQIANLSNTQKGAVDGNYLSLNQVSGKAKKGKGKRSEYEGDFPRSFPPREGQQTGKGKIARKRRNEHDANTSFQRSGKRARFKSSKGTTNAGSFTSGRGFTARR